MSDLEEAELCFQKGMIFSPTVNRPGFWIVHLKSLHTMIRLDETITDSTMPIRDTMGTYPLISHEALGGFKLFHMFFDEDVRGNVLL